MYMTYIYIYTQICTSCIHFFVLQESISELNSLDFKKLNQLWITITLFRLIWHRTELCLMPPNHSVKCNNNLNLVFLNNIQRQTYLCYKNTYQNQGEYHFATTYSSISIKISQILYHLLLIRAVICKSPVVQIQEKHLDRQLKPYVEYNKSLKKQVKRISRYILCMVPFKNCLIDYVWTLVMYWKSVYTQRNLSEILLNQTEIRLYLPFSD